MVIIKPGYLGVGSRSVAFIKFTPITNYFIQSIFIQVGSSIYFIPFNVQLSRFDGCGLYIQYL